MATHDERPLFTETTIHIWRHTASNEVKRRIERNLRERYVIASTYVKAEYINTFLRAAVNAYNVVTASEDLDDALGRWETRWGSQYRLGIRQLFSLVLRGAADKEAVLRRLRHMIEVTILLWFDETVREVTDATRCEAAQARARFNGETFELTLKFPPEEAPEGLREFLAQKHDLLQQAREGVASESRHWKSVRESLNQLLQGNYRLGTTAWQRLSDIIIALEAHASGSEIYTGNVKHFKPVCEAIGLPLKEEHPK